MQIFFLNVNILGVIHYFTDNCFEKTMSRICNDKSYTLILISNLIGRKS